MAMTLPDLSINEYESVSIIHLRSPSTLLFEIFSAAFFRVTVGNATAFFADRRKNLLPGAYPDKSDSP
jgi:hypothetical protein